MKCDKCKRLSCFLAENRQKFPDFYNAPVPNFGSPEAELLIVGLAPGLKGANATGRPFTKDYAGKILYPALLKANLATGKFEERADDTLRLINTQITNAVLCVPPQNKPTTAEIKQCNENLRHTIAQMKNLKIILSLGRISHNAVLQAFGLKQSAYPFGHAKCHSLPNGVVLYDSYHCSLYNISTHVLTAQMFDSVIAKIKARLNES